MLLGAHLSIAGGYQNTLLKIKDMGGNCLQIFSSSPRGWSFANPSEEQISLFLKVKSELQINPVYFHASYLVNLANDSYIGENSVKALINELNLAAKMGIKGSIVHTGSFKKGVEGLFNEYTDETYKVVLNNIHKILQNTPKETLFLIENAGNNKIGKNLQEIAFMMKELNDSRFKVCLDTCHLYSAGYDLSTTEKLETFLQLFDSLIGLDKLEVFHLNDSRDPFNSGRDRHANIGQGTIPKEEFKLLLHHPKTKDLPFIIETPGFDDKGPDKKNLDILKSFLPG